MMTRRTTGRPEAGPGAWPGPDPRRCRSAPLAPAVGEPELGVLGRNPGLRLVGDQGDAGVGVAGGLLAVLGEVHDRVDAGGGHLQRVLLRGGGDLAVDDRLDAGAAAVDRHDHDALFLARGLERGVGAERGRLGYRVYGVVVGGLLQ